MDWPDNFFDAVIDNAAVYSNPFSSCKQIVKEVIRVLKPSGHFISSSFTTKTWGYGKGLQGNGKNEYLQVFEGPLKNRGFVLFFDEEQLNELISAFKQITINTLNSTIQGGKYNIELWIAECEK